MTTAKKQPEKDASDREVIAKQKEEIERLENENSILKSDLASANASLGRACSILQEADVLLLQSQNILPNLAWQIGVYTRKHGVGASFVAKYGEDDHRTI